MRFLRLRATAYGQLHDAAFVDLPHDRVAVVLGENEAGKSTWFHVCKTVLYGFAPASLAQFPYRSWTVDRYPEIEAEMETASGRRMTVRRRLRDRPDGVLESDGQVVQIRNRPLDEVAHIGRSLYETLYALRLEDLAPLEGLQAEGLRDRLFGQVEWSALRSPRQVAAELEQEAARLWRSDRRGKPLYRTLQAELQRLREERQMAAAHEAEQRHAARRIREARALLQQVEQELALVQVRVRRAEESLPLRRRFISQAEGLCNRPWSDAATERLRRLPLEAVRHAISRSEAAWHRLRELEAAVREHKYELSNSERPPSASAAVALGIVGALLATVGALQDWGWLVVGGMAVAGVAGWLASQRLFAARRWREREKAYTARQEEIEAQLQAAQAEWTQAQGELKRLMHGIPIAPDLIAQAEIGLYHQIHRLHALAKEMVELEQELLRQEEAVAANLDDHAAEAAAAGPTHDRERGVSEDTPLVEMIGRMRVHLNQLAERRDELQREIGRLEQQLRQKRSGPTLGEIDGEIAAVEEEMERVARERDRLLLQAALIREAERQFLRERQPDVLQRASAYLHALTGGRYERLLGEAGSGLQDDAGESLGSWGFEHLAVMPAGDAQAIPLRAALSRGMLDQVYFALRLAVIDHLDAGEEPLPFLLDEALVHWDSKRLQSGLRLLGQLARTRQILIFTCHPWLAEAAENEIDAHVLHLP